MCGIAGIFYRDRTRSVERSLLLEMAAAIAHRGPDGEGYYVDHGIGLAHRRLAVIDIAGGAQPVANEDATIQAVFNGEIYNYRALRDKLIRLGHRFRTESDSEVLVHLYETYGDDFVTHLRGMFAIALWDARRRTLVLARDRIGLKPLYFYRDDDALLFGSELKALLASGSIKRSISPEAVQDYLAYGFVPGQACIFEGVRKLSPACLLTVSAEAWHADSRTYWRLSQHEPKLDSEENWIEAVRDKVTETVRAHRVANVEIGSLLSGGIDSTIVTSLLAEESNGSLSAFSLGFDDERFNELPVARRTAERLHCRHYHDVTSSDDILLPDRLVAIYDEPFADSSAAAMLKLCELASRHVKVVLSGDGGDEAFGGYTRYQQDLDESQWRRRIPRPLRPLLGRIAAAYPALPWAPRPFRAKNLLLNLSLSPADAYANTLAICRDPWRSRLTAPLAEQLAGRRPESQFSGLYTANDPLAAMIGVDLKRHLPDDYLVKVDRASMAFGVEVRPPFVDHELLELTWQMPSTLKIGKGSTKVALRRAFSAHLTTEVAGRPKTGFELPIDAGMRGAWGDRLDDALADRNSKFAEHFDPTAARKLLRQHRCGYGRFGAVLWSLLVFDAWCRRYLTASNSDAASQLTHAARP